MTTAVLKLVLSWCMENIGTPHRYFYTLDGQEVSKEYLEAVSELAEALKKVMKYDINEGVNGLNR